MKKNFKGIWFLVAVFVLLMAVYYFISGTQTLVESRNMSDLLQALDNSEVTHIIVDDTQVIATLKDNTQMVVQVPSANIFLTFATEEIKQEIAKNPDFILETPAPQESSWWYTIMPYLALGIIILVFWIFLFKQIQGGGGGGKVMNFGKSRAKVSSDTGRKVTFADVAGADEEKADLEEMVDFLRNPAKYTTLGARIPKGVLLVGPPGTGKTLLAKAVAGEANVPFFSISGSDFVEMFVGVGAARVRDLFEEAKKSTPAVIFIDEIDAVGRHRGAGLGGGHDEREQTLNQLLVEMDGFGVNEGIIIIAATNRPDILDPALLRPGRFDRQVVVNRPDVGGREDVLKVHSKNKKLSPEIDLKVVAQTTAGFTGADLENLLNEAALLAARKNKKCIDNTDIQQALMKVMMGVEKKSRVINEKEKKITAVHEAGHALVTRLLPDQDPVHEVSIIPRGMAGGYTMHLPTEDKNYATKTYLYDQIRILLAGRAAEKVALGDISTGASNDIERATEIARQMVNKYGMSDKVGPISFGSSNDEVFVGRDWTQTRTCSEQQASIIDSEVRNIVESCYEDAIRLISENRNKLELISDALVQFEKLDGESFEQLFNADEKQPDEEGTNQNEENV